MSTEISSIGAAEVVAANAVEQAAEIAAAGASETIAAVIENAAEQVEQAQQTAEDIARAAMESHLGREIFAINERVTQWLEGEGHALSQRMSTLEAQIAELSQTTAAAATLALTSAVSEQSIQAVSEQPLTEAVETVAEVLPETIVAAPQSESTPVEPPRRKAKFL